MPVFGGKFMNSLDQHQPKVTKSSAACNNYSSNSCSSAGSTTSSSNDSALSCVIVNENRLKTVNPNHLKSLGDSAGGFKFKSSALSASHGALNGTAKSSSPSNRLFSSYNHQQSSMTSLNSASKPPKFNAAAASSSKSNEQFTDLVIDLKNNPFSSRESKKPANPVNSGGLMGATYPKSSASAYASSPAQKCLNNLLHTTNKDGKISKRKNKKNVSSMLLQCFNLNEKEKFRQLIAQNSASGSVVSKNIYQNLIKSSPTKVRDDNTVDLTGAHSGRNDSVIEKFNLPVLPSVATMPRKVTLGYSRRISIASDQSSTADRSHKSGNNSLLGGNLSGASHQLKVSADRDIIEIDMTTASPVVRPTKSAQKRHTSMSHDIENDEANTTKSSLEIFRNETKEFYNFYHLKKSGTSRNDSFNNIINQRPPSEMEKRWNETLSKNASFLDELYIKSLKKSNEIVMEEERYKMKKRQRMEKERIEKEIAERFSQQLHLDASKCPEIFLEEEEKIEIEDDFPELDDEQELLVRDAFNLHPQDEVLSNAFSINITRKDINTLKNLNWLNDEVINFYMNLIAERSVQNPDYKTDLKCHTFSTFFYPKLIKDGYASLKRWTRKVDVFSFNLILIPVHLGLHWTLAVIDFNCKEIRYYDSMNGNNNECLRALKNYLKDEHQDKKSTYALDLTSWNCIHVKNVPQQMNGSDCGMFTCKYAEYISRGKTTFNFNQSHMPYFRRRMVWEIINKKLM